MKPAAILAIPATAIMLTACSVSPDDPNRQTKQGAGIGAAIGGLLGAATSNQDLEKTAIGAAIGAAVGGAIGNSLDKQERDLRRDIGSDEIGIVNTGSELRVTMPQDLLFATDSDRLRGDLQSDLRALAGNLRDYPDSAVIVVGHTDSSGSESYNFDLSERRARAVANVLQDAGVSGGRLRTVGQGEAQPVASNASAAGRAQNRRVEIIIRPNAA
jgi:outer membrane protein OmpA-like peptidoglycan-associated protein